MIDKSHVSKIRLVMPVLAGPGLERGQEFGAESLRVEAGNLRAGRPAQRGRNCDFLWVVLPSGTAIKLWDHEYEILEQDPGQELKAYDPAEQGGGHGQE